MPKNVSQIGTDNLSKDKRLGTHNNNSSLDQFWGHFLGVAIAVNYDFGSGCDAAFRIYTFNFITTTSFKIAVFQILIMADTCFAK